MKRWGVVVALAVVAGLFWVLAEPAAPDPARAVLDVAQLPDHVALDRSVRVLDDPSGRASLADVRGGMQARFQPNAERELSRGLSSAAIWLRLDVQNTGVAPVRWLLELEAPTVDDVRLFVVHEDGRTETHRTGDMLPFASRDVPSNTFVFEVMTLANARATIYLRSASHGPLRLPLHAFRPAAWAAAHERDAIGQWLFYGGLLAIALYYVSVLFTVWQTEYLWCAEVTLALLIVQANMTGHVAQYLFPAYPVLANRALPVAVALALMGIAQFARGALQRISVPPAIDAIAAKAVAASLLVLVFAMLAPLRIALLGMGAVVLLVCAVGPLLVRVIDLRQFPELKLLVWCFLALIVTVPLGVLRFCGYLPPHPMFDHALRFGIVAHGGVMSLGLASWVKWMRVRLSTMNDELSSHVGNLKIALARAEEASQRAERATMAKDNFVATMTHELRTPLNAIINIPQGMIDDFDTVRTARCSRCGAEYLLDLGEQVGAETVCEACEGQGTLQQGTKVMFQGDAGKCLHFLKKIERSGQHLLQMVNGVLDYSKLEAGRFQLTLEPTDLEALCSEVVEQMIDLAQARSIQLVFTRLSQVPPMTLDPLRINQVLINLIANAIKFSEPGKVVGVELSVDGEAAVIEVQDAGIGIAKEDHERIFASFEQVHKGDTRKYGGTGLGLSISRSLVRMHGGELSVRSELGRGATFVIRLPRMPSLETSQMEPGSDVGRDVVASSG